MNNDLISRSDLQKFIGENVFRDYGFALTAIIEQINTVPAVDAEVVRHGHWIDGGDGLQICSGCGEEHEWDEFRANYCDNCGAKMDGGIEDAAD